MLESVHKNKHFEKKKIKNTERTKSPFRIVGLFATYSWFPGAGRRRGAVHETFTGSGVRFAAALAAGQQKVGGGEFDVVFLGNRALAQGHAANGRHVRFRTEHVQGDSCVQSSYFKFINKRTLAYPTFVLLRACVSSLPDN